MKKIAVITPYNNEDIGLIKKANDSVFDQLGDNFTSEHIIIVDGIDEKNNLSDIRCHKIELKKNHNAEMINIIGEEIKTYRVKSYSKNEFFFDYLKKEIKEKRKMGHLTIIKS